MKYFDCYIQGVNKLLTYSSESGGIGEWVEVPFKGSTRKALIVEEVERPAFKALEVKNRLDIPKNELVPLVKWMIEYYFLGVSEAFSLLLPKSAVKEKRQYLLKDPSIAELFGSKISLSKATILKKIGAEKLKLLIKEGKIEEESSFEVREYEIGSDHKTLNFELTDDQKLVLSKIEGTDNRYFLIKGVTGSGKTAIYNNIIKRALDNDEGVILLLPEVAIASDIAKRIGHEAAILHSSVPAKRLGESWLQVARGEKKLVIGARSAIFAPVQNLKYIIIDEEHEESYKQEVKPIYDARAVAMKRVQLIGGKLVMGSATPSVERYYHATEGKIVLCNLDKRFQGYAMPQMRLINMQHTKDILHKSVVEKIEETLAKKEQVLVIINRRGYGKALQCTSCGRVDECDNCSISLIYFKRENLLRCSYCGFEKRFDPLCSCGMFTKEPIGKGSELVEEEIKRKIDARVVRFDSDVNKRAGASEEIFNDFKNHKYDIMVGTKLIAKSLDFQNVSLVVVIDADFMLHFPDFRASEKTYQFVMQAAGRAGRGGAESFVYIQTYDPEHYVMQDRDYESFYKDEINFRKELSYPPFSRVINLIARDKSSEKARDLARKLHKILKDEGIECYEPVPASVFKVNNLFRYSIFIRERKKHLFEVFEGIRKVGKEKILIDVDPINLI